MTNRSQKQTKHVLQKRLNLGCLLFATNGRPVGPVHKCNTSVQHNWELFPGKLILFLEDEEFAQKQLSQFGRTPVVYFQIGPSDKC